MSGLLPLRRTFGYGDPALVFPEFSTKLEKVPEGDREGEDSSYGSKFSHQFDDPENPLKVPSLNRPPSGLKETSSFKLSGFTEEEEEFGLEEKRNWSGCFKKCCAWTCVVVSILLIILLLIGLAANSSIKSKLPHVIVTNLEFSKLDFTKSSADFLMNADLNTVLEISNKNDKKVLSYNTMKASVFSENINLGQKKLLGFNQSPGNVTILNIDTKRRKTKVYDVDATLLINKEKKQEAVVNVLLSGKLSFDWMGFKIHLPTVIACENVKQRDVVNGLKPACDVRIFSQ